MRRLLMEFPVTGVVLSSNRRLSPANPFSPANDSSPTSLRGVPIENRCLLCDRGEERERHGLPPLPSVRAGGIGAIPEILNAKGQLRGRGLAGRTRCSPQTRFP